MINEVSRQRSTSSPLGSRFHGFSLPGGVCMPSWLVWIIVFAWLMCVCVCVWGNVCECECARFDTIFHFSPSLRHLALSHPREAFSINGHTFHIGLEGGIWGVRFGQGIKSEDGVEAPVKVLQKRQWLERLTSTALQETNNNHTTTSPKIHYNLKIFK